MIYLDNSATTKIYEVVNDLIYEYNSKLYYNPSAPYSAATKISDDVLAARQSIAKGLNCRGEQIIFTSGGTEANNLAIFGATRALKRGRVICGAGEHDSVYNCFNVLDGAAFDKAFAPLNIYGGIDEKKLIDLMTEDTAFVSVMHVNNETGAVNDLRSIARRIKKISPKCIIHSDGVQAFGKIDVNISDIGCDLYTVSAHKIHGPKGAGALYISPGVRLFPQILGGGQENNLRSGTQNVSAVIGFGKAAEIILEKREANFKRIQCLKERLFNKIKLIDGIRLNCHDINGAIPNILSVAIKDAPAEVMVTKLEARGIIISTGAACSSKKGLSRVYLAAGMTKELIQGTVRISFGEFNTESEIDFAANEIINAAEELQKVIRCKK
jgi:cysteine desulfurase